MKSGHHRGFFIRKRSDRPNPRVGVYPALSRRQQRIWVAAWTDANRKRKRQEFSVRILGEDVARECAIQKRIEMELLLLPTKLKSIIQIARVESQHGPGWQLRWQEPINGRVIPQSKFFADTLHGGRTKAHEAAKRCRQQVRMLLPPLFVEFISSPP